MSLEVFSDSSNPNLWKIQITAKYAKVDIKTTLGVDPSSKETTEKSPKVPFLQTKDGNIFETNAITRYIARLGKGTLYGSNDFETAQIDQFISWSILDVELPANVWILPILGSIPNNSTATQKAKGDVRKALDFLNKHLLTRTFLVGERITIADIVVSMSFFYLYQKVLDLGFRKQYINTNRWFATLVNQPEFKSVVGDFTFNETMEVAPEPERTEEVAEKKKEPKKEQPKKETPKPKPKPAEDEEESEEAPKAPNVLDQLPPSKFVLDEWKRVYSNKDTRTEALPWFWENFDKDGYCLYFCEYKYNNENEKLFMTCNLLGGFIQRLDKLRKYGFGSLCIFGEEPKLDVGGCWLFRGTEIPAEMTSVDDYEHYNWTKVDVSDAAQRELVNDYFDQSGNFGTGRKYNQGKIFK